MAWKLVGHFIPRTYAHFEKMPPAALCEHPRSTGRAILHIIIYVITYIYIYIYITYILITIKVSKMTKVTSQSLYKKNIEIKEKKKKINESSDDF